MDEIHLITHFRMSFRNKFGALKNTLFQMVQNKNVPLLFLTATYTSQMKESLESMLDMKINDMHWSLSLEIVNRNVKICVTNYTKWLHSIKQSLKSNLTCNPQLPTKVIIGVSIAHTITLVLAVCKACAFLVRAQNGALLKLQVRRNWPFRANCTVTYL